MKFRKKKVTIDAIQFQGTNIGQIRDMLNTDNVICMLSHDPILVLGPCRKTQRAYLNDWIILDTGGSYYICKDENFQHLYEPFE